MGRLRLLTVCPCCNETLASELIRMHSDPKAPGLGWVRECECACTCVRASMCNVYATLATHNTSFLKNAEIRDRKPSKG